MCVQTGYLSEEEYVSWCQAHPDLSEQLPRLLFEISHVQLGVRPKSKEDEARVVGYVSLWAWVESQGGQVCRGWSHRVGR